LQKLQHAKSHDKRLIARMFALASQAKSLPQQALSSWLGKEDMTWERIKNLFVINAADLPFYGVNPANLANLLNLLRFQAT